MSQTVSYRTYLLFFLCVLFWSALPAAARAADKYIAVIEIWPPFRIHSPGSACGFTGIDIDILKQLEQYLEKEIEIQRHPFARALEMMKQGNADIITGIACSRQRSEYILYVPTSYLSVQPVFYTQKGRGKQLKTYEDLYGLKIGYSLRSVYFEPFDSDKKLDKVAVPTEEQLIKMVALNRIDATVGTSPNIEYSIMHCGLADLVEKISYAPPQKTPLYFGLSKKRHGDGYLRNKIDSFLQEMAAQGEIQKIFNKYR
ncbi:MAG: hypothetical protein CSA32_04005 [Desulfobulbus propionicus]|nr:MAG: hypothetical protein CSA32_04005 [Desulfobulbus propionicus]